MKVSWFLGASLLCLGQVVAHGQAAAPVFAPAGGGYTTTQVVTLSSSTPGAAIYYTINGGIPTASSTLYTGPIPVYPIYGTQVPATIQAIAIAPGEAPSSVATASYVTEPAEQTVSDAIDFSSGFAASAGSLDLNGSSSIAGTRLRLTNGGSDQAGSAFSAQSVGVSFFTTDFTFVLSDAVADGFTFTIQNSSPTALGGKGAGLGYVNLPNSVAIKFDLYNNVGEGNDSTGIYHDGSLPTVPAMDLSSSGIDLHSGDAMGVHMTYNEGVLNVAIIDQRTGACWSHAYVIDIASKIGSSYAYVGFTAATGGGTATQDIISWTYSENRPETPFLPPAYTMVLNGSASLSGYSLTLTNGNPYQAGSAYYVNAQNIQSFSAQAQFQITDPTADGLTITIQNSSSGPKALGGTGAGLGYVNIPQSLAIKFDLYNNVGEGINSTGLYTGGNLPTEPAIDLTGTGIDLHSGVPIRVDFGSNDGTTLQVILYQGLKTWSHTYTVDIPAVVGATTAYIGLTGSTGAGTSVQTIDLSQFFW